MPIRAGILKHPGALVQDNAGQTKSKNLGAVCRLSLPKAGPSLPAVNGADHVWPWLICRASSCGRFFWLSLSIVLWLCWHLSLSVSLSICSDRTPGVLSGVTRRTLEHINVNIVWKSVSRVDSPWQSGGSQPLKPRLGALPRGGGGGRRELLGTCSSCQLADFLDSHHRGYYANTREEHTSGAVEYALFSAGRSVYVGDMIWPFDAEHTPSRAAWAKWTFEGWTGSSEVLRGGPKCVNQVSPGPGSLVNYAAAVWSGPLIPSGTWPVYWQTARHRVAWYKMNGISVFKRDAGYRRDVYGRTLAYELPGTPRTLLDYAFVTRACLRCWCVLQTARAYEWFNKSLICYTTCCRFAPLVLGIADR